jgi:hypothetical protein
MPLRFRPRFRSSLCCIIEPIISKSYVKFIFKIVLKNQIHNGAATKRVHWNVRNVVSFEYLENGCWNSARIHWLLETSRCRGCQNEATASVSVYGRERQCKETCQILATITVRIKVVCTILTRGWWTNASRTFRSDFLPKEAEHIPHSNGLLHITRRCMPDIEVREIGVRKGSNIGQT